MIQYMIKEMALEGVEVTQAQIEDILAGNYDGYDDFLIECILDMETEWNK